MNGRTSAMALLALTAACTSPSALEDTPDHPIPRASASMSTLSRFIDARQSESLPPDRIELLQPLAQTVAESGSLDLVFICTHNSRRSHLAQVWAQAAAVHFGLDEIRTFSGGTEATAFNPRAVAALERAGFAIGRGDQIVNPVYTVRGDGDLAMECFSKRFDDPSNPERGFAAIMTCTEADQACPAVPGASARFAIPYVDPKVSDGTPEEAATYDERCAQIAREMLWVMKTAAQLARP